jgi:CheY-like chemotaxis protein
VPIILVADDNSNIQKMVSLALKDEGVQVISVGNGEAAVKKMRESTPDLILADIFMPVRSGYEVCEYVKRDPKLAHIPVVLLAGAFDPFDEREAQRVGADAVLKKPFVPPDPLVKPGKDAARQSSGRAIGCGRGHERVCIEQSRRQSSVSDDCRLCSAGAEAWGTATDGIPPYEFA